MTNAEDLIKQYKQSKNKKTLDDIFILLKPVVMTKAKYVYYKKFYPFSLYNRCYNCRQCNAKNALICEDCEKCTCVKGTFNLKRNNLCEYSDVENDLYLDILRMIETYDTTKSWNTYFYASLWNWQPTFLTKEFLNSLLTQPITHHNEEKISTQQNENDNKTTEVMKDFKKAVTKVLTKRELQIYHILLQDNRLKEVEIAEKIGLTQQAVSLALKNIRKKLVKFQNDSILTSEA